MHIPAAAAAWFLPFVLPICFYVAFTDMREMRIKNHAVMALLVVYLVVGLFVLPPWSGEWLPGTFGPVTVKLPLYAWQLLHIVVVLIVGIILNAAGIMGAGDAKFCAAAAAFIWASDFMWVFIILSATLLGAFCSHRLAKHTRLRQIAPHWDSWDRGKQFPMGLTLAGSLVAYLILGIIHGS
ncbi:prepilin peptidase [Ruegeria conchae]|uniref:Prepilin peptidase CpaA n=1 Tax=Ruegeria conchae TaxID=981384 RepID=A0A497ZYK4_9RHOB|nr:prepilin peptidase [Ruegeria conchae]RLK11433.1 prepilin peptidase CpaA [Ruegeria conchae]